MCGNFRRYGLGEVLDSSIHFVEGFLADSLPLLKYRLHQLAVLCMDGDPKP